MSRGMVVEETIIWGPLRVRERVSERRKAAIGAFILVAIVV